VAALRQAVSGIALTTDIIVGFPGETEDEFRKPCRSSPDAGFDDAFTFKLLGARGHARGQAQGTTSAEEVQSERLQRLIAVVV